MDVQGLLYNNDLSSGHSSGPSSRGIMATHPDVNGQPYVQAHHQMSDFDSFPTSYGFDTSQVQYHSVNVLGHSQPGFHGHYPQPHSHNSHHNGHQHQSHHHQNHQQQPQAHPSHQQTQQHPHHQSHPQSHHAHQPASGHHVHQQSHQQSQQQQQQQQQQPLSAATLPLRRPIPVVSTMSSRDVRNSTPRTRPPPMALPPRETHHSPAQSRMVSYSYSSQEHPQTPSPPPQQTPQSQSESQNSPKSAFEAEFKTDVDTLMKAIQAKKAASVTPETPRQRSKSQQLSPQMPGLPYRTPFQYAASYPPNGQQVVPFGGAVPANNIGVDKLVNDDGSIKEEKKGQKVRKRYECEFEGCNKSFFQKTHLEIHTRAHSGDKPYPCTEPGCGQRFSQMGNLKTHQRRHTGERPFACEHCGKRFAQRGNVRAHKIVHQGAKPFTCQLDACGKKFTQLGNLKSHQNKFHASALRALTEKFATRDVDSITSQERELFEYFAELYKNSNKGIKGRGKDRKISSAKKSYTDDGEHRDDMMTSPTSCGSGSQGDYDFSHEMDDESSVDSPYHDASQHLPPLRGPGPNALVLGNFGEDGMTITDMAKFRLDGKFQV